MKKYKIKSDWNFTYSRVTYSIYQKRFIFWTCIGHEIFKHDAERALKFLQEKESKNEK